MNSPIIGMGRGMGAAEIMSVATALLAESTKEYNKLPPEERERRRRENEAKRNERIRQAQIIQNICPTCEGKLVRGKKDKKNDYKRTWKCSACMRAHSI